MIETHECSWCKKTIPKRTNFCGENCRREYNKFSTEAKGIINWDFIEKHRPGAKTKYYLAYTAAVCTVIPLNLLLTVKVINIWVFVLLVLVIVVINGIYAHSVTRIK
jgi:hypothetical protein